MVRLVVINLKFLRNVAEYSFSQVHALVHYKTPFCSKVYKGANIEDRFGKNLP